MDTLYIFITTALPKAGTLVVCDSSSSESDLTDDAEVSRIGRGLRSAVCVWSVSLVSRADVFRHIWQWFMKPLVVFDQLAMLFVLRDEFS